jgi:hypothetical protein
MQTIRNASKPIIFNENDENAGQILKKLSKGTGLGDNSVLKPSATAATKRKGLADITNKSHIVSTTQPSKPSSFIKKQSSATSETSVKKSITAAAPLDDFLDKVYVFLFWLIYFTIFFFIFREKCTRLTIHPNILTKILMMKSLENQRNTITGLFLLKVLPLLIFCHFSSILIFLQTLMILPPLTSNFLRLILRGKIQRNQVLLQLFLFPCFSSLFWFSVSSRCY